MKRRVSTSEIARELEGMQLIDYDEYELLMRGYKADINDMDIDDILDESLIRYRRYIKLLNLDDYGYILKLLKMYIKMDVRKNKMEAFRLMKEIDESLVNALEIEDRKKKRMKK